MKDDQPNALGISRAVYGLGESFKKAFIWGSVATVVSWLAITFRSRIPALDWTIAKGLQGYRAVKATPPGQWVDNNILTWMDEHINKWMKGPVVALSLVIGTVIGHLIQIPSSVVGWKKADTAIRKYNTLHDEKNQLVETNAMLMEDKRRLKAALENASRGRAPLSERVQAAGAQPGQSL